VHIGSYVPTTQNIVEHNNSSVILSRCICLWAPQGLPIMKHMGEVVHLHVDSRPLSQKGVMGIIPSFIISQVNLQGHAPCTS